MTAGDDKWPTVSGNLQKARNSWERMSRVLRPEGADLKVLGPFFKAVVQALLLFGAEKWVMNPSMERSLSSFHHRVARRVIRRQPRRWGDGSWDYPVYNRGSGLRGDWDLHHEEAEYGHAVYCDANDYGPL